MRLLKTAGLFFLLVVLVKACGAEDPRRESSPQRAAQSYVAPTYQSAAVAPAEAQVPTRYIGPERLNARSTPNGNVVDSLKKLTEVLVYASKGSWVRISKDGAPERWVSADYLCTTPTCSDSQRWSAASNPPPVAKKPDPVRSSSTSSSSYGSPCSCASTSNCYGPRGGRYCITSGGNKRYR